MIPPRPSFGDVQSAHAAADHAEQALPMLKEISGALTALALTPSILRVVGFGSGSLIDFEGGLRECQSALTEMMREAYDAIDAAGSLAADRSHGVHPYTEVPR